MPYLAIGSFRAVVTMALPNCCIFSAFLAQEGALAMVRNNGRHDMAILNAGYQHHAGKTELPAVVLAADHYMRVRIIRIVTDRDL